MTSGTVHQGFVTIGIDPGARYTGVAVRDAEGNVLHASTIKRADATDPVDWAKESVTFVKEDVLPFFPDHQVGIEKVTTPNPYMNGRRTFLNPKDLISLALVVGAMAVSFPDAVLVRPGKNGSQPLASYPDALRGRRPKDLPGRSDGSRDHQRSAYDVAGVAEQLHREQKTQPAGRNTVSPTKNKVRKTKNNG